MATTRPKSKQYNYNQASGKFVANPSGIEKGNVTGNRVFVSKEGELLRFKIEIDDFGCVIGALNELVQKLAPTFKFPRTRKNA